jgi:hypothetical protein
MVISPSTDMGFTMGFTNDSANQETIAMGFRQQKWIFGAK